MNIRFDNKTVLITGATSGIGLAAAELFGGLGARVAICGTREEKLRTALAALHAAGVEATGELCDVGDAESLEAFAGAAARRYGPLDVWIGNASIYPQGYVADTPPEVWDRTLAVNLKSAYIGARIVREQTRGKGGVMLLASSFASLIPSAGSGVYAATKAATSSLVKTLAAELAPHRIRVNGYIPGVIDTEMTHSLIEANGEAMRQAIAMQRFGEPIDVAWALAFLASDYARYITGTMLEISGGKLGVQNPDKAWRDAGPDRS